MRKLFSSILELVRIKIEWEVTAKSLLALIPLAAMVCTTVVLLDQGARGFLEKLIARHLPVRGPVADDELDHHEQPNTAAPMPQAGDVVQPSQESEQRAAPPAATEEPSATPLPNLPTDLAVPQLRDTEQPTEIAEAQVPPPAKAPGKVRTKQKRKSSPVESQRQEWPTDTTRPVENFHVRAPVGQTTHGRSPDFSLGGPRRRDWEIDACWTALPAGDPRRNVCTQIELPNNDAVRKFMIREQAHWTALWELREIQSSGNRIICLSPPLERAEWEHLRSGKHLSRCWIPG